MFNKNMAISKNLIALCFICLLLFTTNVNIDSVYAVDVDNAGNDTISAINEDDKLENSHDDSLLQATKQLNGGTFKDIQNIIHNEVNNGDTIILNGDFTANEPESHIIVYKNITITSTSKATLNANNISSIFVVESGGSGSSFSNLILKNGNGNYGGAMLIYGKDVKVTDCEFIGNYANSGGGAIYTDYEINLHPDSGKNLLVQNCIFENNSARINSGAIGAYGYYTKILNCTFLSNWVYDKNGHSVYGGAMQVGRKEYISNSLIKDCKFINNSAISISKEIYSHGGAACIREGVTYENCLFEGNSADRGGALTAHCSATVKNCTFLSNLAHDFGGALYNVDDITSTNLKVVDCNFEYNAATYGGAIKLDGNSITIELCNFNENHALLDGGAIYVNSRILDIFNSNFTSNYVKHNGGAVYVNGESTTVQDSYFKSNRAIASPKVKDDGLGGAIYINGTSDKVRNNVFEFNVARNGSAIYYDESGEDLLITNNVFNQNQAWVYALPVYANDIYYGESETIGAIIYGGNNIGDYDNILISNSIYNAALNSNIKINGLTPVSGATNSGEVYQDSREYNVDVLLTVKHSDGTVVYNNTVKSSYLGESSDILTNLKPGVYTLTATHFEDNFYKAISNSTTFAVKPKIDVKLRKATQNSEYNYHDLIMWTINVVNNGPNNATNVKVSDVLPDGLVYRSHDATVGTYSNGVWDIGNLTIGESATLNIITLINKTGDITNNANVSGIEFDWDLTNNDDSEKISVNDASDLSITKNANVTYADYGDLVKWTIVVKNNGPDIAHNVNVTDILPLGLVFRGSNGDYDSGIWTVGTLGVGESKSLEIVTLVNKTGAIVNTASVIGSEYDYNPSNNVASKTISIAGSSDLEVLKDVNVSSPNYGDLVRWTVTVRNNGPDAASGVNVTDVLPAGLVSRSAVASKGSYANGVWTVGDLDNGASATLTIVCLVDKTGTIENVVSVVGNEYDYDSSNNVASKMINVPDASDLEVSKTVNVSNPNYGDLVKWSVTVKNNGPDMAHDINVTDVLPSGLVIKSVTGEYNNGKWTIESLGSGESMSFEIVTLVNKTGRLTNKVSAVGREYDYNPANNNASRAIDVADSCDLEVLKDVNVSNPNYHDLVRWTVTVRNNGPDAASGVNVTDVLPAGLVSRSAVASKGNYTNGVWTVGDLGNGDSATLTIVCLVDKTGAIENIVSVVGNEYDYDSSNNVASKMINVPDASDLEVSKTVNVSNPNYGDLVKWSVTVKNNGPDTAHNVILSDLLPEGLIVKSTSANYDNGKWIIDSLGIGNSMSFEIVTLVNKTGTLTNFVSVIGDEYDINKANNNASRDINVPNAADLEIIKTVNDTAPNYLNLVQWTITVKNNGPDTATGVNVTDILPNGLIYQSYTATKGNYSNGIWTVGELIKGESATLKIISKVNKTENITNVVYVVGNEYDINKTNNAANESISTPLSTDLEIIKMVSNSTPNYHDLVKWTIIVKNNGPDDASDVVVEDIIPNGLVVRSVTGNYSDGKFYVGLLKAHSSTTLEITTFVNKTGLLINNASVSGHEYDYNMSNNLCNSSINVSDAVDLEISKIVDNSNPNYKTNIKLIILVKNNGPDKATNVQVNEVLGEEFELIRATASKGGYINNVWTIGELDVGEAVNLEIITKIIKTGNFTNVVNVSSDEYDYDMSNNEANRSIVVDSSIDLEIIKKVNNTSPNYNDLVKWSITVRNNGPDNATVLEIRDILQQGLGFENYTATKGYYENGFWKFCCLEVGEEATLEIITRVLGIGEIKNMAVANAKEYDHNPDNNGDEASINVALASDLQITKLVNQSTINYKESVKWTLIVKNNGPSDATGVVVLDTLPNGLTLVSSTGDGSYSAGGTWNVGELSSGQTKRIDIITRADATGEFRNVAVVKSNQHDYNPINDRDEKVLLVKPAADLAITKTVSKIVASVGDLLSYSIELTNNGPDTAQNIKVNEIMDDALLLKSFELASGDYDTQNNVWNIKSLASNEKTFLNINAVSTKEGFVENKVSAIADTFDFDLKNNGANVVVEFIKKVIDQNDTFNPSVHSRLHNVEPLKDSLVSKASLEMKKTGIPVGLLIVISVISIAFLNSNRLKKR